VNELELQAEARLCRQNAAQPLTVVTRDDHGFTDPGGFKGFEDTHAQGDAQNRPQRLRHFVIAFAQSGARSRRQDDRSGHAWFCHGEASLSSQYCKLGSHLARAVTSEQILLGSHT
jgi:hypothetical protein